MKAIDNIQVRAIHWITRVEYWLDWLDCELYRIVKGAR